MTTNQEFLNAFFMKEGVHGMEGLIRKYQKYVFSICLKYSNSYADAEDSTQEVLLKLTQKLNAFTATSKFSTWLYSITRNYCFDQLKSKQRESLKMHDYLLSKKDDIIVEEVEDMRHLYIGMIAKLTEEDQLLLKMKYIEAKSIIELSQYYSVSESCIKMRLSRVKEKVRQLLKAA